MSEKQANLQTVDLEQVVGGRAYYFAPRTMRGYIDSLKGLQVRPSAEDALIAHRLGGHLSPQVGSKPRGWLGGDSINGVVSDPSFGTLPTYRWSR